MVTYSEDFVDIIIPFYPSESGYKNLEQLKKSLEEHNPGFPYNLIVAEGKKPAIQNMNDGLHKATSRYILKLDDDVKFITSGWLKTMVDRIKHGNKIGIVGVRILDKDMNEEHTGRVLRKTPKAEIVSMDCRDLMSPDQTICFKDLVAGCCMLFDRTVAGYFAEKLYLAPTGCDDSDYMLTILSNGYNILYCGDIDVLHLFKTPEQKEKLYPTTINANHVIFMQRWMIQNGRVIKEENDNGTNQDFRKI